MAKKRVHEIAKERGMSSKDVLAVLQKAGFDVKAAASSVDEADIAKAFANGADGASDTAAKPKAAKSKSGGNSGGAKAEKAAKPKAEKKSAADDGPAAKAEQ